MSAYTDAVLATPGLLDLWVIGEGYESLTSSNKPMTIRNYTLAHRPVTGWVGAGGDPAAQFSAEYVNKEESFCVVTYPTYSGAYSIEVLAYVPSGSFASSPMGIFATDDADLQYGPNIWLDPGDPNMPIRANFGNGTAIYTIPLTATFTRDAWHHVVLAVGADGSWEFVLDGVSKGTGIWDLTGTPKLTKFIPMVPQEDENALFVGTMSGPLGGSTNAWYMLNGYIQHFAVYNTKITASQVLDHYQAEPLTDSPYSSYTFTTGATRTYRAYTWTGAVTLKNAVELAGTSAGTSTSSGELTAGDVVPPSGPARNAIRILTSDGWQDITYAPAFVPGSGPPTDDDGVDGAIYFDYAAGAFYGPKADGAWPGTPITIA